MIDVSLNRIDPDSVARIEKLMNRVAAYKKYPGSSWKRGWLIQPLPFQEFQKRCICYPGLKYEAKVILKDLERQSDFSVLDIGCANGMYLFELYHMWSTYVGYEPDSEVVLVTKALLKARGIQNAELRCRRFCLAELDKIDPVDVLLLLSTYEWIYRQSGKKRGKQILCRLAEKVGVMYFQTGHRLSGGQARLDHLHTEVDVQHYLEDMGFTEVTELLLSKSQGGVRALFRCLGQGPFVV